jgi:hypothetical protein
MMASSLKQQVRAAIKRGETELALELLKGLENPKPKKLSKMDMPYRSPFTLIH